MVKAIETVYKGYRFRSRLEARWAVFFDALGIKWEYEHEGFELKDGTRYLPDFYLPEFEGGVFVEVKPDGGDFSKARVLGQSTEKQVWLAEGTPRLRAWTILNYWSDGAECLCAPLMYKAEEEYRFCWEPPYFNGIEPPANMCEGVVGNTLLLAIAQAKGARFEHGERH